MLQSLSMLAIAPHASMAAVQALDVAYKSWTKIENTQCIPVQKEYIVDQVETFTGTTRAGGTGGNRLLMSGRRLGRLRTGGGRFGGM